MSDGGNSGPNIRVLTGVVIGLGVLIVVLFGVVIVTVVVRATGGGEPPVAAVAVRSLALPRDSRIVETTLAGERLVVRVALPEGGERLLIIDTRSGAAIGSIDLVPER